MENQENKVEKAPIDYNAKVEKIKTIVTLAKNKTVGYIKQYPKVAVAVAIVVITLGYYMSRSDSTQLQAIANTTNQNNKLVMTQNTQEVSFVVLSGRKTNDRILLNNHKDYRQATQTVVIELKSCPSLNNITIPQLINRTVKVKGVFATYDGKPQVIVHDANDIKIQ